VKAAKPSDWKTKPLPKRHTTIPLDRSFSLQEMRRIRKGLIPDQMEDKWFIYWEDSSLYFHRSWTGYCVYVVRFAVKNKTYRIIEADINRSPGQYKQTSDEFDAGMIMYLVNLLLLRREVVFPGDDLSSGDNVLKAWSLVGRALLGQHPDKK